MLPPAPFPSAPDKIREANSGLSAEGPTSLSNSYDTTLLLILGIIVVLVMIIITLLIYCGMSQTRKWKKRRPGNFFKSNDSMDPQDQQPILGGINSLRDMIDMTTSGSGSGKYFFLKIRCSVWRNIF